MRVRWLTADAAGAAKQRCYRRSATGDGSCVKVAAGHWRLGAIRPQIACVSVRLRSGAEAGRWPEKKTQQAMHVISCVVSAPVVSTLGRPLLAGCAGAQPSSRRPCTWEGPPGEVPQTSQPSRSSCQQPVAWRTARAFSVRWWHHARAPEHPRARKRIYNQSNRLSLATLAAGRPM